MAEQKTTVELVTKPLDEKTLENVRNLNGVIQDMVSAFGQAYLRRKELDEEHQILEERLGTLEEDFKKASDWVDERVKLLEEKGVEDLDFLNNLINPASSLKD